MATVDSLAEQIHPAGGGARIKVAQRPARALGLVAFKTSEDRERSPIGEKPLPRDGRRCLTVERNFARARRCRQSIITRARVLDEQLQRGGVRVYSAMLTLTYARVDAWAPRHVSDALEAIREWMSARGHRLRYVWSAELQQRGAVHYHVLLWLPRGVRIPKPDRRGWWVHGSSRIEGARNPVGYLAKYASKLQEVERFPRGLRLAGAGGLDVQARAEASWWMLPKYVRDRFALGDRVRRAPGGGFVSAVSGEWVGSTWCLWDRARDWAWITFAESSPGGDHSTWLASSQASGDTRASPCRAH